MAHNRPHTPETRQHLREVWTPERRAAHSAKLKASWEERRKTTDGKPASLAKPSTPRAKTGWTEEKRQAARDRMRAFWSDPTNKARAIEAQKAGWSNGRRDRIRKGIRRAKAGDPYLLVAKTPANLRVIVLRANGYNEEEIAHILGTVATLTNQPTPTPQPTTATNTTDTEDSEATYVLPFRRVGPIPFGHTTPDGRHTHFGIIDPAIVTAPSTAAYNFPREGPESAPTRQDKLGPQATTPQATGLEDLESLPEFQALMGELADYATGTVDLSDSGDGEVYETVEETGERIRTLRTLSDEEDIWRQRD